MPVSNTIDFSALSPEQITDWLSAHQINLTVDEVLTIQQSLLKRPPTLAECVLWSIQGSEHCSYKSTRKHLKQFVTTGPHVILGPREDAGVVSVATDHTGKRYGVVMSHESHNHPSQIVPYEGAATGVGGNVRDVSCMGAEVIAVADSLRFGALTRAKTHFIHEGVVSGIAGYGNPLGIPNIAGDLYYHPLYNDNCLVTVATLGIVREDHLIHSYAPRHVDEVFFILVGKPTDNSGFGGASFASKQFAADEEKSDRGAVQEPNAFLERHLLKANNALFAWLQEKNLVEQVGFKDLGAGGVACASVELSDASGLGVDIDLDAVPTSMTNLPGEVILCSETQERFMWAVPQEFVEVILKHYNETFDLPNISEGARAALVGKSRRDGLFVVTYQGEMLVNARASDVTKGIEYDRPFVLPVVTAVEPATTVIPDAVIPAQAGIHVDSEMDPRLRGDGSSHFNSLLLQILSHENVASRAPVFETYDKQVQGRTVIEAGVGDSGVMQPFNESRFPEEIRKVGIALSLDHNPRYNEIDPYWGAVNAVCESVRNVVAVGAFPRAITDCLCFGDPSVPHAMGEFVVAVQGIAEACKAVTMADHPEATLPVIAGNVSLYNASPTSAIPASPMISCLGVMPDVASATTYAFKATNSMLVLVGERRDECGGSVYYALQHVLGANVPKPDLSLFNREIHAVYEAIQSGLVLSAHDISEGGVATALAEMSFKNQIGVKVAVQSHLPVEKILFSETGGFILEVTRHHLKTLQALFESTQVPLQVIGETTTNSRLSINQMVDLSVLEAKAAWENGLRDKLSH